MKLSSAFITADDGTVCPLRLFGLGFAFVSTAVFMALSVWTVVVLKTPLDYGGLAGGMAALWGTVSAAVVAKRFTEKRNAGSTTA